MDEIKLINAAACAGDAATLNQLLQQKPFILSDTAMINSNENVLNTAIKSEHFQLSIQIARSNSHILTIQDRDGVRPIDVASAYGFVEMVREILNLSPEICRLAGKDGKTAIHHACINGRIDVINELMEKCPDCVRDVTSFGETALHLAVKYYKFEALKSLVQWLERVGMMEIVNSKDKDGNTVLHYAASRKQLETVELVLVENMASSNMIEVNAKNTNGLTAMDLVSIFIESSSDYRLKQVLQDSNASHGAPIAIAASPSFERKKPKNMVEMVKYVKFNYKRDSPSELRNALLVVVALFITLGFQATISLPAHIFPDPNRSSSSSSSNDHHEYSSSHRQVIYLAGTTGLLSVSLVMMDLLTEGMPFKREMFVAYMSLVFSWGCSIYDTRLPNYTNMWRWVIYGVMILMTSLRIIPMILIMIREERKRIITAQP